MPKRNSAYWEPKLAANAERDRRVDEALAATGWQVIRVWEHEDAAAAAARIAELVRARGEAASQRAPRVSSSCAGSKSGEPSS